LVSSLSLHFSASSVAWFEPEACVAVIAAVAATLRAHSARSATIAVTSPAAVSTMQACRCSGSVSDDSCVVLWSRAGKCEQQSFTTCPKCEAWSDDFNADPNSKWKVPVAASVSFCCSSGLTVIVRLSQRTRLASRCVRSTTCRPSSPPKRTHQPVRNSSSNRRKLQRLQCVHSLSLLDVTLFTLCVLVSFDLW
jgi:hypothetical protein